jgi:hypothetical protein
MDRNAGALVSGHHAKRIGSAIETEQQAVK